MAQGKEEGRSSALAAPIQRRRKRNLDGRPKRALPSSCTRSCVITPAGCLRIARENRVPPQHPPHSRASRGLDLAAWRK
eukprot:96834-Prorocentrum_lima.AAC.1